MKLNEKSTKNGQKFWDVQLQFYIATNNREKAFLVFVLLKSSKDQVFAISFTIMILKLVSMGRIPTDNCIFGCFAKSRRCRKCTSIHNCQLCLDNIMKPAKYFKNGREKIITTSVHLPKCMFFFVFFFTKIVYKIKLEYTLHRLECHVCSFAF